MFLFRWFEYLLHESLTILMYLTLLVNVTCFFLLTLDSRAIFPFEFDHTHRPIQWLKDLLQKQQSTPWFYSFGKIKSVLTLREYTKNAPLNVTTHFAHNKGWENTFLPIGSIPPCTGIFKMCGAYIILPISRKVNKQFWFSAINPWEFEVMTWPNIKIEHF